MKKAFTLVEVMVSIAIFMVLILFLYKTLDQAKYSNKQFSKQKDTIEKQNNLNNILIEDIAEIKSKNITITKDRNSNSIVSFKTNNTFHNPYYQYITYLIDSNKHLVRMESRYPFDSKKKLKVDFFKYVYIDILLDDIEYFVIKVQKSSKNKNQLFIIKQNNKKQMVFKTFDLR